MRLLARCVLLAVEVALVGVAQVLFDSCVGGACGSDAFESIISSNMVVQDQRMSGALEANANSLLEPREQHPLPSWISQNCH